MAHGSRPVPPAAASDVARGFFGVFRYSRRAMSLVWSTSHGLTIALGILTLLAGILPAAMAWVGALIIDAVLDAAKLVEQGGAAELRRVFLLVAAEGGIVAALAGAQRGISLCQSLLRAQLGQRVNVMILEKALTLELAQFEDSEFYDKLTRARREASSRPLSLVMRTFGLAQNGVSLVSYGALLVQFSPWAVVVLMLAGLPSFFAEAKFSGDAFRLFRWRSPETRMQMYLETVLAREDHVKEVKLFGLGPLLLERYRDIFRRLYKEDRALTIRRDGWGFVLGLIGTLALYGAYAWIAVVDGARPYHPRSDDDVSDAVPPGPGRGVSDSVRGWRHVRRQSVPVDAIRFPGDACAGSPGRQDIRPGTSRWHPLRGRQFHLSGRQPAGAVRTSICTSGPVNHSRWWVRTVPARPP